MTARVRSGKFAPCEPSLTGRVTRRASVPGAGGVIRNSARFPGPNRISVAATGSGGGALVAPSCEFTGTPTNATTCIGCGSPLYRTCRSTMSSPEAFATRHSCGAVPCVWMTAGVSGHPISIKFSDRSLLAPEQTGLGVGAGVGAPEQVGTGVKVGVATGLGVGAAAVGVGALLGKG